MMLFRDICNPQMPRKQNVTIHPVCLSDYTNHYKSNEMEFIGPQIQTLIFYN